MTLANVLKELKAKALNTRQQGDYFEQLIKRYLKTDPLYANELRHVWYWKEFYAKEDIGGGQDVGIDLVGQTYEGEFWAIQCKFYDQDTYIDKEAVDTFLSSASRKFSLPSPEKAREMDYPATKLKTLSEQHQSLSFSKSLFVSTTNKWSSKATDSLENQTPPCVRLLLSTLESAGVDWEKLAFGDEGFNEGKIAKANQKQLRPHQKNAIEAAKTHYITQAQSRGKLIMACGTGKTYTSLKLAESICKPNALVLFLVPSIALLGQTLREWASESELPILPLCVCSDPFVSKGRSKKDKDKDQDSTSLIDLALPATTDSEITAQHLHSFLANTQRAGLRVVFSTYQSIEVVQRTLEALKSYGYAQPEFDLIICDEAHRTTGVTLAGADDSAFVKVHDNAFLPAKRRLYMTATPRLYADDVKSKAKELSAELCSMDDEALYGTEFFRIGFGEAVDKRLLTDYKVLVLTLSEKSIPAGLQQAMTEGKELNFDDQAKLVGCINALSKKVILSKDGAMMEDRPLMRRAVAFSRSIAVSKEIKETLTKLDGLYRESIPEDKREGFVKIKIDHIDGGMGANERDVLMNWLKAETEDEQECRILTNVRCLSEGVDVPTLDAVLFLSERNSQVDVVQSVGRVMRLAPGKDYGYIIIPVFVPSHLSPEEALRDNKRFAVVWTVLNALRAHDDRFNALVNKLELNKTKPNNLLVGGVPAGDQWESDSQNSNTQRESIAEAMRQMSLNFPDLQTAIYARMVEKVGDKRYWEQWAKDVARIAENQINRITRLLNESPNHQQLFDDFLKGLHKNINPSITAKEATEMLAQHLITKPVFEALFENYSFASNNAVSQAMEAIVQQLDRGTSELETETLQKFYESVRMRAEGIDNAEGKQRIIIELYDKFFKAAFPKMVEKLGIVYTPVEVVDFIIHSVNDILTQEFGRDLADENVHILDPFTGTGTFITRLLQSGLIPAEKLKHKYQQEIHANEIVLLAYYIAAINIENAFHDALGMATYIPFDGICLTDTFQLGEEGSEQLFSEQFAQNNERVKRQKKAPLRVIIGNPPYSAGQKSANDNAQNQSYPLLDKRIANTYVEKSNAVSNKSIYDSYIKAFRWATDRLDPMHGGLIGFVTNGAWLDGNSSEGLRLVLEEEFSAIYVFNLRGNQRTSGELSRKEGGKIFGSGSRTPVAITFLVKKPQHTGKAKIYYRDIGDYLSREQKLSIISKAGKFSALPEVEILQPNEFGDWITDRKDDFYNWIPLDAEKKFVLNSKSIFITHSLGLASSRDAWVYDYDKQKLGQRIQQAITYYNQEVDRVQSLIIATKGEPYKIEDFINFDSMRFHWSTQQKVDIEVGQKYVFNKNSILYSHYRPFNKRYIYFNRRLIQRVYQQPSIFPTPTTENLVICVPGIGVTKDFSVIISNTLPDLELIGKSQCFPLYYYEEVSQEKGQLGVFDQVQATTVGGQKLVRRDAVSDYILQEAQARYGAKVSKEDIFYFVYGFLHEPAYAQTYADDLKKSLPRLPLPERNEDFWAYAEAGRELAALHLNYENQAPYEGLKINNSASDGLIGIDEQDLYRVEKMSFPKKGEKDKIIYNAYITIENIPLGAYDYVVNGKSAIEWVMERYTISTHKESGIVNDPNDWAIETGKPRYILDLLLSVITVSLKTQEIVGRLPKIIA